MTHKTRKIHLSINVDKGIVNTVKYLNSLSNIHTLYSCEGDEENKAYILFICNHPENLFKICSTLRCSIELCPTNDGLMMRYRLSIEKKYLPEVEKDARRAMKENH